ncbi:MAG: ATP-binding cassette domain-containing protein, partial [Chitinivibrionales bacterium]|nr:ATP-binding cassette domain-containing protein [Chitinivibrionales bacterium]MBD3357443.1 ATP-binding cassette domain-containing protein [Chitinivibrionales bacterium]
TYGNRIELQWREVNQERFAVERDIVAGLKTFKSLGRTDRAFRRYVQVLLRTQEMYFKLAVVKLWFLGRFIQKFLLQEFIWGRVIRIYVYVRVLQGAMTLGDLGLVTMIAAQLEAPITRFVMLVQNFRKSMVPARRVYETMGLTPMIKDKPNAPRIDELTGRFALDNVTFSYDGEGPAILKNVSFEIEPGQRVAFVGPSGAGKSTIFKLLLRLYDPVEGSVLLDGKDIRDYRLKSILDQIGVVMQDTHIFSGSIKENIRFGDMYASNDRIMQAVEDAELTQMVEESPDGVDTFLGEGTKLSGGQKQRIGIARALLRNPKIFIFDEPTAHVDVVVETKLFQTIQKVTRGVTTMIISHRISPVLFVDKLAVLTSGGIEAFGTHRRLLETSPTYQNLWAQQNKGSA